MRIALTSLSFLFLLQLRAIKALWPIPNSLETGSSFVRLAHDFDIKNNIHGARDLEDAIGNTMVHIMNDKLGRLTVGRGMNDRVAILQAPSLKSLSISLAKAAVVKSISEEAVVPLERRQEGYSLTIPSDGREATLTANSTLGLLRGLTTFEQLWYDLSGTTYTFQAPVKIVDDTPAYPYRGYMLDTSRNYFPVKDIKRTLDTMSLVKLNTFHWHATDQHSFPLDIPGFSELAEKGSYSPSEVYTAADIADIVSYANTRGIDVLIDIDSPGHTAAIAYSHPEHIACAFSTPWSQFANEPPAGQLRIASTATANFTANLVAAVASISTSSMFSTGGDELNINCYSKDDQTQAELKATGKTLDQALNDFLHTEHSGIMKLGKTPVVKADLVLNHNISLANDTIIIRWSQNPAAVAATGHRFIQQDPAFFYLDCGAGGWIGSAPTLNSWCDPFKSWQKAYTFDPHLNLTSDQHSLVLGGQQPLWTEQSGPENLDPISWPRAAVSAEIFWTGSKLPNGSPRNVTEALPRLLDVRYRMVQRGVKAIMLQPHWCALRPGLCELDS